MWIGTLWYRRGILDKVVRKDFSQKVVCEDSPAESERISHADIWGKAFQAEGTATQRPRNRCASRRSMAGADLWGLGEVWG